MKKIFIRSSLLIVFSIFFYSCDTDPTIADKETLEITSSLNMRTMVDGAYFNMNHGDYLGRNYILTSEVMSDNAFSSGRTNRYIDKSKMTVKPTDTDYYTGLETMWKRIYSTISQANLVINSDFDEILEADPDAIEVDMSHTLGEAYILRAWAHFDALRLWGRFKLNEQSDLGIPYMKEFNREDMFVARQSVEDNERDIYNDIDKGIEWLKLGIDSKWDSRKTNITLDAAYAFLSRVGVYFGEPDDYKRAKEGAEHVIDKYELTPASDFVQYWANSSVGAASIFELENSPDNPTSDGGMANLFRGTTFGDVQTFKNIVTNAEFGANDVRASDKMIGPDPKVPSRLVNLGKYPSMDELLGSDNIKVMRYAEVVLNYAEALYNLNELGVAGNALFYLNQVPNHRNGTTYSTINMDNILKERRKELIYEGMRFHDLKRTGRAIPVGDAGAPNNHGIVPAGDNRMALPIPQHDMDSNPNMVQNLGY